MSDRPQKPASVKADRLTVDSENPALLLYKDMANFGHIILFFYINYIISTTMKLQILNLILTLADT